MKDLIITHYREPKVDTNRIMQGIRLAQKETRYSAYLVPGIFAALLLLSFGYFLADMNFEFLSAGMDLYQAIGGIAFFFFNLAAGVCLFVSRNYPYLLLFSTLAALTEFFLLSLASNPRSASVPSLSR